MFEHHVCMIHFQLATFLFGRPVFVAFYAREFLFGDQWRRHRVFLLIIRTEVAGDKNNKHSEKHETEKCLHGANHCVRNHRSEHPRARV